MKPDVLAGGVRDRIRYFRERAIRRDQIRRQLCGGDADFPIRHVDDRLSRCKLRCMIICIPACVGLARPSRRY